LTFIDSEIDSEIDIDIDRDGRLYARRLFFVPPLFRAVFYVDIRQQFGDLRKLRGMYIKSADFQ